MELPLPQTIDQNDRTFRDSLTRSILLDLNYVSAAQLATFPVSEHPLEDEVRRSGFISHEQAVRVKQIADNIMKRRSVDQSPKKIEIGSETREAVGPTTAAGEVLMPDDDSESPTFRPPNLYSEAQADGTRYRQDAQHPYGRYQLVRAYSQGGLGVVSIAFDSELRREVALKELRHDRDISGPELARFRFEGELTSQLEHPGIVPVYGLGETDSGRPFYAMRFIKGITLRQAIREFYTGSQPTASQRNLWLKQMIVRFIQICRTIQYAHQRGIIHRDIKPANIMLGAHGETLVVDWGLAKRLSDAIERPANLSDIDAETEADPNFTQAGAVVGTLAYMSPEQAVGQATAANFASDIFSLGATLFAICTGKSPYHHCTASELPAAVRAGRVANILELMPSLPRPLVEICNKSLAFHPEQRYSSAEIMASDLERWLADEPVSAYRETMYESTARTLRRRTSLVVMTGVLLVSGIIGALVMTSMLSEKNQEVTRSQIAAENSRNLAQATVVELLDRLDLQGMLKQPNPNLVKMIGDATVVISELNEQQPNDPRIQLALARVQHFAGNLHRGESQFDAAEQCYEKSDAMFQMVSQLESPTALSQYYYALMLVDRAQFFISRGRSGAAMETIEEVARLAPLLEESPTQKASFARVMGEVYTTWVSLLISNEKFELAETLGQQAIDHFTEIVKSPDATLTDHVYLLANHTQLLHALISMNRWEEGELVAEDARNLLQSKVYWETATATVSTQYFSATLYNLESRMAINRSEWQEAVESAEIALADSLAAHEATGQSAVYLDSIVTSYFLQTQAYWELGEKEQAREANKQARQHLELFIDKPAFTNSYRLASRVYEQQGEICDDPVERKNALAKAQHWRDLFQAGRDSGPENQVKAEVDSGNERVDFTPVPASK